MDVINDLYEKEWAEAVEKFFDSPVIQLKNYSFLTVEKLQLHKYNQSEGSDDSNNQGLRIIYGFLLPFLCLCGIILSIITMNKIRKQNTAMTSAILCLLVSELLKLLATMILFPSIAYCSQRTFLCSVQQRVAPYIYPLVAGCHVMSVLICMIISIDRLTAVSRPFSAFTKSGKRKKGALLFALVLSVGEGLPRFWEVIYDPACRCIISTDVRSSKMFQWVYQLLVRSVFGFLLPFSVVIINNGLLIYHLFARRDHILKSYKSAFHLRQCIETTLSCLIMVIAFVATNLLYGLAHLIETLLNICGHNRMTNVFKTMVYMGNLLVVLGPILNAGIYCAWSRHLRRKISERWARQWSKLREVRQKKSSDIYRHPSKLQNAYCHFKRRRSTCSPSKSHLVVNEELLLLPFSKVASDYNITRKNRVGGFEERSSITSPMRSTCLNKEITNPNETSTTNTS